MATISKIPVNNLGSFLTQKNKVNIEIYSKTGISTVELSKLRNGMIKGLDAKKLYLILKASELSIEKSLQHIYPDVTLLKKVRSEKKEIKSLNDFFNSVQENTLAKIAESTGITLQRIKNIKGGIVKPMAHELFLIELSTETKIGTLFTILYNNIELFDEVRQEQLRTLERNKSIKKDK